MTPPPVLSVREMQLADVGVRISYFHDASDEHLHTLGVDRARLPSRAAWQEFYELDYARPITERVNYSLIWQAGREVVGFSSVDRIDYGTQAFMHLHIVNPGQRRAGMGVHFVKRSAAVYFRVLELRQLFCQPNAFNVAPNRTLQRAGFRYLFTHHTTPSEINYPQAVTRWVLERPGEPAPPFASAPSSTVAHDHAARPDRVDPLEQQGRETMTQPSSAPVGYHSVTGRDPKSP